MAVVVGAANAYLGLMAGMTIAATYTTAVLGMAVLKPMKGTLLEENAARTVGSIGGNIATGAIFTLPAFFISSAWPQFFTLEHYLISTIILIVAGVLGIMFVTILRRVLVDDAELPFPESIAAQRSTSRDRKDSELKISVRRNGSRRIHQGACGIQSRRGRLAECGQPFEGNLLLRGPGVNPAYFAVGYIIGPKLGALNFSGGCSPGDC